MWEFFAAIVSAFVALIGLVVAWRRAREAALRKEDVHTWSNAVIRNMQSLVLVCERRNESLSSEVERAKLLDIFFETSVLAEQGRLFFKNELVGKYGHEKPPAYRGYRPEILDQVLMAHAIARRFASADEASRARMCCVAEDAVRRFVSLAQKEVGRSRTASPEAGKGGVGTSLETLMQGVALERLRA
jgi:hypothetical protein